MEYVIRQVGDVSILDITGRIDLGVPLEFGTASRVGLQQVIRNLVKIGHKNFVLNLHEVVYIDSSGIGDLVGSATTVRKHGGELRVVNPSMVVRDLLRVTRVDTMIEVKPDEVSVLEAFSQSKASGASNP